MLLMHRDATVRADVVVAAVGRAEMAKREWIKEGAIVMMWGLMAKRGYRIVYRGCGLQGGEGGEGYQDYARAGWCWTHDDCHVVEEYGE